MTIQISKLIHIFFKLLGLIPRRYTYFLAYTLGDAWYLFDSRHRAIVLDNLFQSFSHEKSHSELQRIARGVFRNLALIPFEIGWSLSLSLDDLQEHCEVIGQPNLIKAHSRSKGIFILTAHVGNWELLPMFFQSYGLPASFVYRPLDFEPANQFFFEYRSRYGCFPIPKKNSMRKIIKFIMHKGCVGILLDQDARRKAGIFADFFGRPASTNMGLALMALKTGAPVIPAFVVRHGLRFRIIFGPEIPLIRTGQKEIDIQANTSEYNRAIETIIREYPDQWFWVHKRWKTRP